MTITRLESNLSDVCGKEARTGALNKARRKSNAAYI